MTKPSGVARLRGAARPTYAAVMTARGSTKGPPGGRLEEPPPGFAQSLKSLRSATLRPEVILDETPAPQRLAPYALALTAEVQVGGEDLATGRLVVLHDPEGQDAWSGPTRLVAYVRATCEPEMAADPLLPAVGWAWLEEALGHRGATFTAASGTVTRVASESFGGMAGTPAAAEVEIRASWTPVDEELGRHLEAWGDLLCQAAGLPPLPPGVATLSKKARTTKPRPRRR